MLNQVWQDDFSIAIYAYERYAHHVTLNENSSSCAQSRHPELDSGT